MKIILTILIIISSTFLYAQRGIYKCSQYEFKSEPNPSLNSKSNDLKILTIDFDAIENKFFIWREKDEQTNEEVFFKWNIKQKVDANYDRELKIVRTTYYSKIEILGIEMPNESYIYKIDDLNDDSLNIIIYNPKEKTSFCFYKITKL